MIEGVIRTHKLSNIHKLLETYYTDEELDKYGTPEFKPNEEAQRIWKEYMDGKLKEIPRVK